MWLGKRKQAWRSDLGVAKAFAREKCIKIANGSQEPQELKNGELLAYSRAIEILSPTGIHLDTACRDFVDALAILGGKASIAEACREWVKRNSVVLPKISVAAAGELLNRQAITDGKSKDRRNRLSSAIGRLAASFSVEVHTITPDLVSQYLAALPFKERTKRNHRDTIGYFNRWLVLRGYLARGTDWLEGVQNYTARKIGEIEIYTPDELKKLLTNADKRFVPFLAIGAFAGLRTSEIERLDWSQVELSDKPSESYIEILPVERTKSDQRRRLVPVKDNLRSWLMAHRKKNGKVCPFANTAKQQSQLAAGAGVPWKHNALRHSAISYRIAESGDVARVSDESGNSPTVIRSNYLRRVKPALAAEWFSIMPPAKKVSRKLIT